jgi:hypothetical protein
MSVYERIIKEIHCGMVFYTPVQSKPFKVKSVNADGVVFLARKTNIEVSIQCWNGIPDFLKNKGWVLIGAKHIVTANLDEGTLEKYLRKCTKSKSKHSQGSYVAPLLEHLKIVKVKHTKPSAVKLI